MRLSRPQSPDSIRPRPARGAEVALGIHEEEDGVEFDPKKDIFKEDWEGMKGKLEEFRRAEDWRGFGDMVAILFVLFPNRRADLRLDTEALNGMKEELKSSRHNKEWWRFYDMAKALSLFFPDSKVGLDIHDELVDWLKEKLERLRSSNSWWLFSHRALDFFCSSRIPEPTSILTRRSLTE